MRRILRAMICAALCIALTFAGIQIAQARENFDDTAELLQIKSHIEKDAGMSRYATVQGNIIKISRRCI